MSTTTHDTTDLPKEKGAAQDSAALRAVFGTFELLEAIMLEMPILDLLDATQTCKTWEQTFTRSKKIRKILFESAVPGYRNTVAGITLNNSSNPVSSWIFRTDFKPSDATLHGQILVLYIMSPTSPSDSDWIVSDWTIFAPTDRSQDMRIDDFQLKIDTQPRQLFYVGQAKERIFKEIRWLDRANRVVDTRTYGQKSHLSWNKESGHFIDTPPRDPEALARDEKDRLLLHFVEARSKARVDLGGWLGIAMDMDRTMGWYNSAKQTESSVQWFDVEKLDVRLDLIATPELARALHELRLGSGQASLP